MTFPCQDKSDTASYTSILLNNQAVNQFKAGNMLEALETFSQALDFSQEETLPPAQGNNNSLYRYHWVDCTSTYASRLSNASDSLKGSGMCLNEGVAPFLCLRALKISLPVNQIHMIDCLCPCACAWAIEFNLGLVCNIMGARLGERGHSLLQRARQLFLRVQERLDQEQRTKDWTLLQMAVANNLACIFQELGMKEDSDQCLCTLDETLSNSTTLVSGNSWDTFHLNSLILRGNNFAPAA